MTEAWCDFHGGRRVRKGSSERRAHRDTAAAGGARPSEANAQNDGRRIDRGRRSTPYRRAQHNQSIRPRRRVRAHGLGASPTRRAYVGAARSAPRRYAAPPRERRSIRGASPTRRYFLRAPLLRPSARDSPPSGYARRVRRRPLAFDRRLGSSSSSASASTRAPVDDRRSPSSSRASRRAANAVRGESSGRGVVGATCGRGRGQEVARKRAIRAKLRVCDDALLSSVVRRRLRARSSR